MASVSRAMSWAERLWVPLKSMCSMKWAAPDSAAVSSREPPPIQIPRGRGADGVWMGLGDQAHPVGEGFQLHHRRSPSCAVPRGRGPAVIGTRYRWGPPQVITCGVVSRPYPGRGSRLSLRESPDAKSRRGFPPAPPGIKPLAGARSIFWVGALCGHLFLAHVHQTRFGNAYSEKIFFAGSCSAKNLAKENLPKDSPQIRARTWAASKPTTALLRLYPQNRASEQRAALKTGVQGRSPLVFFPPFLT